MRGKFKVFDPYKSYSSDSQCFVRKDGQALVSNNENINSEMEELWRLGKNAFQEFGEFESEIDFNKMFQEHQDGIKIFEEILEENSDKFSFKNQYDQTWKPDFSKLESLEILGVYWQFCIGHGELYDHFAGHFLFACLEEIDLALMAIHVRSPHLHAVIAATTAFSNYQAISTGNLALQKERSDFAYRAAKERHANDPKQSDKNFVFECWSEWRKNPSSYKSKAAFARDMLDKCENLESQKVIEDWCRHWERGASQ